MNTLFRAHDAPQRSRVEYWQHVVQTVGLPLRGRHDTADFRAQLVAGDIGPVRVLEGTTPAGECYRTASLIAESNRLLCEIDVVVDGQIIVEQDNRQAHLRSGDFAYIDPALPVRYRSSQTTHVTMLFPCARRSSWSSFGSDRCRRRPVHTCASAHNRPSGSFQRVPGPCPWVLNRGIRQRRCRT